MYLLAMDRLRVFIKKMRRAMLRYLVPELVWPISVNAGGVHFAIRGEPFSFGCKLSLVLGTYEKPELHLISKYLASSGNILEYGSSLGFITNQLINRRDEGAMIVSVEASEKLAKHCQVKFSECAEVHILHGAGIASISLPPNLGLMSFDDDKGSLGGRINFDTRNSTSIPIDGKIYSIAIIEKQFDTKFQTLVCDIEGAEIMMCDRSFMLPHYLTKIFIELHPHLYDDGHTDLKNLINCIKDQGFNLIEFDDDVYFFNRTKPTKNEFPQNVSITK